MKNDKLILRALIVAACFYFLFFPFQSAGAFWPFPKKPAPSDELTLILDVGRKGLVEEMGGALREGRICETAVLELALDKLIELTHENLLEAAKKTFLDIEKTLLAGSAKIGKDAWDIVVAMGKSAAKQVFDEKMDEKKSKEKNENLVLNGKTSSGCDYKMVVEWFKQEPRHVHVSMSGDCHCKEQITTPTGGKETRKPLSKFSIEFDIDYFYEILEYEIDGKTVEVVGHAGGIRTKEGPFKHPFERIAKIWYEGIGEDEDRCGCKGREPVKKVSAGPGAVKSNGALAFVNATVKRVGAFLAFKEKVGIKPIDNTAVLMDKGLSVDKEILDEIMGGGSTSTTPPKEESERLEQEKGLKRLIFEFLRRLKKKDGVNFGPSVSEKDKEEAEEEVKRDKEAAAVVEGAKKEVKEEKKETPKPKPAVKPKSVQKLINEIPPEQDVCGDGKITGMEICDGNLFSKMCLDAVAEYKAGMGNPNLAPRCFNNCRGCEASVPQ